MSLKERNNKKKIEKFKVTLSIPEFMNGDYCLGIAYWLEHGLGDVVVAVQRLDDPFKDESHR